MNSKTILSCLLMTVALGMTIAIISKSSRRSVDQRLDEEALARMDDEGGANNPAPSAP
jgi:hypothetical protein